MKARWPCTRTPEGVSIEDIDMGGIAATVVSPDVIEGDRVLLYIHGGGYVAGSPPVITGWPVITRGC